MDFMLGQREFGPGSETRSPLLGILYAEDFDELPAIPPAPEPQFDAIDPAPPVTQADIEQACLAAVEQARIEWEQEAEHQRQRMLAAIAQLLAATREDASRQAASLAEGTVMTMLSMLAGALPALCREHGASEARA